MVGIVGGLLIAAAFLAFVAANWSVIARPPRFANLVAGIAGAYGVGAVFDRFGRPHLADLARGGLDHFRRGDRAHRPDVPLGEDFAGGMLLWPRALAAAVLTGSRGALAVALAAACVWSGMRVEMSQRPHLPFIGFWLMRGALAIVWNAPVARHLVGLAALGWMGADGDRHEEGGPAIRSSQSCQRLVDDRLGPRAGGPSRPPGSKRAFGLTLSTYARLRAGRGPRFEGNRRLRVA